MVSMESTNGKGGTLFIEATTSLDLELQSLTVEESKASLDGGFACISSPSVKILQQNNVFSNIVSNLQKGGIFRIVKVPTVTTNITVLDSTFTDFKSSLSGSFIIIESDTVSNA